MYTLDVYSALRYAPQFAAEMQLRRDSFSVTHR